MRTPILPHRIAALTLTAVALLGMTACSGLPAGSNSSSPSSSAPGDAGDGSGDGTQTTAEACQLIQDTITDATAEFENVTEADPSVAAQAFAAAAERIGDSASQISNEEVAEILPPLQDVFEQVADILPAIMEGDTSRSAEFEQIGTDLNETLQQFEEVCAPE